MRARSIIASLAACLAATALAVAGLAVSPTAAGAQTNPYQRGPAPTSASLDAAQGSFAVQTVNVGAQSNFAGGTIYYPTDTSQGTFGGVVVTPGFLTPGVLMGWAGTRIASNGFVVFVINTTTIFDFPNQRATQMRNALNYLVQSSSVRDRVDGTRLATTGWSMGGGGTLEAAATNSPQLQAAVAWQPWDLFVNFGNVRVPTMIVGAQNDVVAGVGSHAEPFYTQIPAASEKAYVEVAGAGHQIGASNNTVQGRFTVAWLKRYVDDDTRYDPFLCPRPSGMGISEYRDTCPTGS